MLKRFLHWYCSSWWHTGLVTLAVILLLILLVAIEADFHVKYPFQRQVGWSVMVLLAVVELTTFFAGLVHLFHRRWCQGLGTWFCGAACLVGGVFCACLCALASESIDVDHFADDLKLPEGVALAEPESARFVSWQGWAIEPTNSFQYQVLNAPWAGGADMKDGDTGAMPALAALMKTSDGRTRLIRYLACDPEWCLYKERDGLLYATRQFRGPDGSIQFGRDSYYSGFVKARTTSGPGGTDKINLNDRSFDYQFRFGIGLGKPGITCRPFNDVRSSADTRVDAGGAFVEVFAQTTHPGRQMTAKALELADKEFAALELPTDAVVRGAKPDLVLTDGMEGGIYVADILCNPGEQGELYLKAYEITHGTRLSEDRLAYASSTISGWSENTNELFASQMGFTIYEGNWNQYYGARFELWFKPASGAPERKLLEKNYKIQGWMR